MAKRLGWLHQAHSLKTLLTGTSFGYQKTAIESYPVSLRAPSRDARARGGERSSSHPPFHAPVASSPRAVIPRPRRRIVAEVNTLETQDIAERKEHQIKLHLDLRDGPQTRYSSWSCESLGEARQRHDRRLSRGRAERPTRLFGKRIGPSGSRLMRACASANPLTNLTEVRMRNLRFPHRPSNFALHHRLLAHGQSSWIRLISSQYQTALQPCFRCADLRSSKARRSFADVDVRNGRPPPVRGL